MGNDKIKEILDRLDYNEWEVDLYKVPITWCELYDIRDYITKLEQAVKDTKDSADDMLYELKQELEEEKRIEEADLKTIQRLEEENEELKSKLECYENGVYYSSKVDKLEQENERLKEENNHKAMNDYAHAIDESWYRELYDDYKSRCEKASDLLTSLCMLDNVTITNNACEKIDAAIKMLQNGSDDNEKVNL